MYSEVIPLPIKIIHVKIREDRTSLGIYVHRLSSSSDHLYIYFIGSRKFGCKLRGKLNIQIFVKFFKYYI